MAIIVDIASIFIINYISALFDVRALLLLNLELITLLILIIVEIYLIPFISLRLEYSKVLTKPEEILSRSSIVRAKAKRSIEAVWCFSSYDYEKDLKPYFEKEHELLKKGIKIRRIINNRIVSRKDILDHCNEFKEEILNGSYKLSLSEEIRREFLIIDRQRIIIYEEAAVGYGPGLAFGPYEFHDLLEHYIRDFEQAFEHGKKLSTTKERFDDDIQTWLE
jgi:hypothetical protein